MLGIIFCFYFIAKHHHKMHSYSACRGNKEKSHKMTIRRSFYVFFIHRINMCNAEHETMAEYCIKLLPTFLFWRKPLLCSFYHTIRNCDSPIAIWVNVNCSFFITFIVSLENWCSNRGGTNYWSQFRIRLMIITLFRRILDYFALERSPTQFVSHILPDVAVQTKNSR